MEPLYKSETEEMPPVKEEPSETPADSDLSIDPETRKVDADKVAAKYTKDDKDDKVILRGVAVMPESIASKFLAESGGWGA